jgi:hypothetical protein
MTTILLHWKFHHHPMLSTLDPARRIDKIERRAGRERPAVPLPVRGWGLAIWGLLTKRRKSYAWRKWALKTKRSQESRRDNLPARSNDLHAIDLIGLWFPKRT